MSKPKQEKELRCPLCLERLGSQDQLIALKLERKEDSSMDDTTITLNCDDPDLIAKLLKFGGNDLVRIKDTDKGICLSHINCNAKNLFYENGKIKTEYFRDGIKTLKGFGEVGAEKQKDISHWIIRMLSKIGRKMNDHTSMWFPYPLFRAVGTSSLVELVGSQGVGKTVLTLQLTNKKNFIRNLFQQNMEITDYVYIHDNESYWAELALRTEWENYPISRPLATNKNTPGDIRAIFIRRSTNSNGQSSVKHQTAAIPQSVSSRRRLTKSLSSGFRWVIAALHLAITPPDQEKSSQNGKNITTVYGEADFNPDTLDHFYSIIFYDTAGEGQPEYIDATELVRQHTDKLVICIDAKELLNETFGEKNHKSIKLALERIENLTDNKKRVCLLITQLDMALKGEELEKIKLMVEQIPNETKKDEEIDKEIKEIILERLNKTNNRDKQDLLYKINNSPYIERVFFVWTQGLPKMGWLQESPIENFDPKSGRVSDEIAITLKPEHFDNADISRIAFGGIDAKKFEKENHTLRVIVPDGAQTGLIEIDILYNDTELIEASSENIFVVEGCSTESEPQSFGVLRFLSWCLDRDLDEILNSNK